MKQGKKPTRTQRSTFEKHKLDTREWLVVRTFTDSLDVINKKFIGTSDEASNIINIVK